MKITLARKVSIGFLIVVIGAILIVGMISNYMIDKQFNQYLANEHKHRIEKIIGLLENVYDQEKGFANMDYEEIQRIAILEDLYIEIRDQEDGVVFSSGQQHLMSKRMMGAMHGRMMGWRMKERLGEYIEEAYVLQENGVEIGKMVVGYFGSWNLTEQDIGFKDTLNQSFFLSATIALVFGLMISFVLSRQIAIPLQKMTGVANEMREGNLQIRADMSSNTVEIHQLSKSLNHLAETLQDQDMLRKRLTTDMAHEIRTPLTTLKAHIEAFMDGIWEPTEDRFQSCYEEIERITKMVGNLQDLAKLEQTNLNLNKEVFDLSEELIKMVESMKPQFQKKNISVEKEIAFHGKVLMDKDKVKQIFLNLLSNAHKYTKEDGNVEIALEEKDEGIILTVRDDGIGIAKEDIPYIFERFYRGDVSRSRDTGGTGIGLTIVKTLVEAHEGRITVESEEKNGSVFRVIFPKTIVNP